MARRVLPLEDGSYLLAIVDVADDDGAPDDRPDGSFLGASDFLAEAAAAGAIGNLTYATLRNAVGRLHARFGTSTSSPLSPEAVTGLVKAFLAGNGYEEIVVGEFGDAGGQGFFVRGHADGHRFDARAEPSGTLVHVRID